MYMKLVEILSVIKFHVKIWQFRNSACISETAASRAKMSPIPISWDRKRVFCNFRNFSRWSNYKPKYGSFETKSVSLEIATRKVKMSSITTPTPHPPKKEVGIENRLYVHRNDTNQPTTTMNTWWWWVCNTAVPLFTPPPSKTQQFLTVSSNPSPPYPNAQLAIQPKQTLVGKIRSRRGLDCLPNLYVIQVWSGLLTELGPRR